MLLLCVVMTLAYIGESSVTAAGSDYLTKGLKSSDTFGGLVVGAYTLGQVLGRFRGDLAVQRFGSVKVVRAGAVVCAAGFAIVVGALGPVHGARRVPHRRPRPVAAGAGGVHGRLRQRPDRVRRRGRAHQRLQLPGLPARRPAGHRPVGRGRQPPGGHGRPDGDDRRHRRCSPTPSTRGVRRPAPAAGRPRPWAARKRYLHWGRDQTWHGNSGDSSQLSPRHRTERLRQRHSVRNHQSAGRVWTGHPSRRGAGDGDAEVADHGRRDRCRLRRAADGRRRPARHRRPDPACGSTHRTRRRS